VDRWLSARNRAAHCIQYDVIPTRRPTKLLRPWRSLRTRNRVLGQGCSKSRKSHETAGAFQYWSEILLISKDLKLEAQSLPVLGILSWYPSVWFADDRSKCDSVDVVDFPYSQHTIKNSICHDFATVRLRVIRFMRSKLTSLAPMMGFLRWIKRIRRNTRRRAANWHGIGYCSSSLPVS
jgi:hypothetical protein